MLRAIGPTIKAGVTGILWKKDPCAVTRESPGTEDIAEVAIGWVDKTSELDVKGFGVGSFAPVMVIIVDCLEWMGFFERRNQLQTSI